MKQILVFLISIIQTLLYSLLIELLYFTLTPNQKLIIGTIFPFIILIFFVIVLIQNVLTSILNKKIFTWMFFTLSTGLSTWPFFNPFRIWLSLSFCLIIFLILLIPMFVQKYYRRTVNNKPIA